MNVFIVTSTISTQHRSHFTTEQRLEQTVATAQSIDRWCPNSYKLIIDGSGTLTQEHVNTLRNCYNMVLIVNDMYVTSSHNISYGEISMLQKALVYIQSLDMNILRIFKLSGRYTLTSDFDLENYPIHRYCFYRNTHHNKTGYDEKWGWMYKTSEIPHTNLDCYLTVLYMIPPTNLSEFNEILNTPLVSDVEHLLYDNIPKEKVHILSVNGVEGTMGSNGTYIRR